MKPQKKRHSLYRLFRDCLLGYGWFLSTLGKVALFLLSLLLAVSLIVIPLWYLSTTYPTLYGYLVIGIVVGCLFIPLFLRFLRGSKNPLQKALHPRIGTKFRGSAFFLIELFLLLGAFRFYQEGNRTVAVGICFLFLFVLGIGLHRCHERER
ncbi:MAG: hypothetical protein N2442_04515 [Spirochaetes bacterium]|nr:hypothetical protein [Spirochaetota bacterium]